jgi:hypothetical protein
VGHLLLFGELAACRAAHDLAVIAGISRVAAKELLGKSGQVEIALLRAVPSLPDHGSSLRTGAQHGVDGFCWTFRAGGTGIP